MNQEQENQEVSVLELFEYFKKGFKGIFRRIANLMNFIYRQIIKEGLVYAYIHYKKILALLIGGVVLGVILDQASPKKIVYEGATTVKPNFNSTEKLYYTIDVYNQMIINQEYDLLSELLSITVEESKSITNIFIEPVKNNEDVINQYYKMTDGFVPKEKKKNIMNIAQFEDYSLGTYMKDFSIYQYTYYNIIIQSTNSRIFKKIERTIFKKIEEDELYSKAKTAYLQRYKNELAYLSTLVENLNNSQKKYAEKTTEAKGSKDKIGVNLTTTNAPIIPEVQLVEQSKEIYEKINKLKKEYVYQQNVVTVMSSFPETGKKISLFESYMKLVLILTIILGISVAVFIRVIEYIKQEVALREKDY